MNIKLYYKYKIILELIGKVHNIGNNLYNTNQSQKSNGNILIVIVKIYKDIQ